MVNSTILVTGSAGFIGFHLSSRLCKEGYNVIGVDNLNSYYSVDLKQSRLQLLLELQNFQFQQLDIGKKEEVQKLFESTEIDYVINLAAQAGVRYSIVNPFAYTDSNIGGFLSILEACRHAAVRHLIFASTSSVYGANTKIPFAVKDNVDHPISLYAATKKANELMAHCYASLYEIPVTGLRFFTVYGPWGRPDMALFKFTKNILEGNPIDVYNHGNMKRDFTYVDDIVEGVFRLIKKIPQANKQWNGHSPDPSSSFAPYRIFNIGNSQPVDLMEFISVLEETIGKKATINFLPMQDGDVPETYASVDDLEKTTDFKPRTPLSTGIRNFVEWYKSYYGVA